MEVGVSTSQEALELVSNFLMELGSQGVVLEELPFPDGEGSGSCIAKGYFPCEVPLAELVGQINAYLAMLEHHGVSVGSKAIQTRALQEEDWASSWKQYFKPVRVGRRLVIKPDWEPYEAGPHELVIHIDPGMAFGTGKHETTQLCLEFLEEEVYPGARVLDVGTGSGILAIAAAKLGASRVWGLDTDPVALRYARENVIKNAVQHEVSLQEGSLSGLDGVDSPLDLVVINIRPDVILSLLEPLRRYLKPEGILILSGVLQSELEPFIKALRTAQLTVKGQRSRGEWITLVCTWVFSGS